MKSALAALASAAAIAACSSGVLDLHTGESGGGSSTEPTGGASGSSGSSGGNATGGNANGGASSGGAGPSSSSSSGGSCPDPNCPCGLVTCLGACVDTHNDPSFCGGCANSPCKHNETCREGKCECLPGFTMCDDGVCHQLASDPDHCGTCTKVCSSSQACDDAQCKAGCEGGRTACAATNSRLTCVNLDSGEPYCGSCGTICGPTQVCAGKHCVDFKPATPCNACPCADACDAIFTAPASCCAGIAASVQPICVHAETCTP